MKEILESYGYCVTANKHCLLAGDPEAAWLVVSRHSNTPGVAAVLEIARTMPENQRHKVCFALLDGFPRNVRKTQMVFWFDQMGYGDQLVMIPTKRLQQDRRKLTSLYKACGYFGKKSLLVREKKFCLWLRPYYGVKIQTMERPAKGTASLDETNVNILRAALTNYICRTAAQ